MPVPSREQMDEFIAQLERSLGTHFEGKTFSYRLIQAIDRRYRETGDMSLRIGPNDRTLVVVVYGPASDRDAFKQFLNDYFRTVEPLSRLLKKAEWRQTGEYEVETPASSWDFGTLPIEPVGGEAEQYAAGLFTSSPEPTVITVWTNLALAMDAYRMIDSHYRPEGLADEDYQHQASFHLTESAAELTGFDVLLAAATRVYTFAHLKVSEPVEYIYPPDREYSSCFHPEAVAHLIERTVGVTVEDPYRLPVVEPEDYQVLKTEKTASNDGCDVTRVYSCVPPKWLRDAGHEPDCKLVYSKHYDRPCDDSRLDQLVDQDFAPCTPGSGVTVSFQGVLPLIDERLGTDGVKTILTALQNTGLSEEAKQYPIALVIELRPGLGEDVVVITRDEAEETKLLAYRHTVSTTLTSTAQFTPLDVEGVWIDVTTGDVLVTTGQGTIYRLGEWTTQLMSFVDEGVKTTLPRLLQLRAQLLQAIRWMRSSDLPADLLAFTLNLTLPRAYKNLEKDVERIGVRALEKTIEKLPDLPPEQLPPKVQPDQVTKDDTSGHTLVPIVLREIGVPLSSSTTLSAAKVCYLTLQLPTGDKYHIVSLEDPPNKAEIEYQTLEPVPPEMIRPVNADSFANTVLGLINLESAAVLAALSEQLLSSVPITTYDTSPQWRELLAKMEEEKRPAFALPPEDLKELETGPWIIIEPPAAPAGGPEVSISTPTQYEQPQPQPSQPARPSPPTPAYVPTRSYSIGPIFAPDAGPLEFPLTRTSAERKEHSVPFDPSPITDDGPADDATGVYGPMARFTLLLDKFREGWGALWE